RAMCIRHDMAFPAEEFENLLPVMPSLVTPGAAEALAVKVYRTSKVEKRSPVEALRDALDSYQPPVAPEVLAHQMELAIAETSDLEFVPESLRGKK
ncbi:MAG: hypothetical protein KY445_09430, partial [Armatimonadetes bacterium]|nr:hypothetical protein [Armatimonadota bacterium]